MGENIWKWSNWQRINLPNIQTARAAQYWKNHRFKACGIFPDQGSNPSPALAGGFLTTVPPGKPRWSLICIANVFAFFCDTSGIIFILKLLYQNAKTLPNSPSEQLHEFTLLQQECNFSYYFCLFLLLPLTIFHYF